MSSTTTNTPKATTLVTTKNDIMAKTEAETLATFRQEIPSQYFSHLDEKAYKEYTQSAVVHYRDHFKFPPQMFKGADLIDFGAGTGENTIYLANWGAKCTLVEMNDLSQKISKDVFAKYAKNKNDHQFFLSSIFDYNPTDQKLYDIVHCRGVLSHTAAKEQAFKKISTFLKPGGFLIFGDPNKAGGFQNMIQRYAVYHFAKNNEEMVDVCEFLFKEDIDRSEKAVPRTRRAIIFDRWVIQSQDDPSVAEVASWAENAGLQLYSCYPPVLPPLYGDSFLHRKKLNPYSMHELFSLAEATWMMQTISDSEFLPQVASQLRPFANALTGLTSYVANFNARRQMDTAKYADLTKQAVDASKQINAFQPLQDKLSVFLKEAQEFVEVVRNGNLKEVRSFIEGTEHLFRGACGVRHIDFIAYKPEANS